MPKSIAFFNQKGGVSKTGTALLATDYYLNQGKKVLVIDLDPQASLTKRFMNPAGVLSFAPILQEREGLMVEDIIVPVSENLSVIGAGKDLWSCVGIDSSYMLDIRLQVELAWEEFDVVLIDCPPNLTALSAFGVILSNAVVMPVVPDTLDYEGLQPANRMISHLIKVHPDFEQTIYFISRTTANPTSLRKAFIEKYKTDLAGSLMESSIPESVVVSERIHGNFNFFERKQDPRFTEFFQEFDQRLGGI